MADKSKKNLEKIKKAQAKEPNDGFYGAEIQPIKARSSVNLDIDTEKKFTDTLLDATVCSSLDTAAIERFTNVSNARDIIYQLIDTMLKDSSVTAIVKTFAENVCEPADSGHLIWCESADPKVSKFVNYLLDTMNVDKNMYNWVYSLISYGDVYLRLYRESDYKDPIFRNSNIDMANQTHSLLNEGVESGLDESIYLKTHAMSDPYSYYVEMIPDPSTMFELTRLGKTYGYIEVPNEETQLDYLNTSLGVDAYQQGTYNFRLKTNNINIYQADDFVHACLEDNRTRYPEKVNLFLTDDDYNSDANSQAYTVRRGKSLLYDSYKVWREKSLLENAILLNRLTKSSYIRTIQVEVGDMPKSQVENTLRRVKNLIEQKTALNTDNGMTEYTNPGPVENNIYLATHEGKGGLTIGNFGGDVDVKQLTDLDFWNNKFYSGFGIPKQYMGWTDDGAGFNGGTSLSVISSVFAKGVKRIQNAMIQAVTDAVNLILVNRGCKSYLNQFVLKMRSPTTQEEKDYRENLTQRVSAISNIQSLFADVEDKSRKLTIIKELVSTLNYGNEILYVLDQEIEDAEAAKAAELKAKEEEEKAKASGGGSEESAGGPEDTGGDMGGPEDVGGGAGEDSGGGFDLGMDLGNSSEVPLSEEYLKNVSETLLGEDVIGGEELPMPEELKKDFTKNE